MVSYPTTLVVALSIPLIKDKTGNLNDVDNSRAVTLSSDISKLFEMVLLEICEDFATTDSLLFGFKNNVGCMDAIFTLKSTVKCFIDRGSSVYVASLGIRKAFD